MSPPITARCGSSRGSRSRSDAGELVCLLGGNASGKSTTLKTILGIVPSAQWPGADRLGEDVTGRAVAERIARGLAIVPENRRLFGYMTVRENLELGAVLRKGEPLDEDFDRVHTLFPRLHERPTSSPARCRAASSRWSRWGGR